MYTVAMAYCGTGNNAAVRKLLHVAVSFKRQENVDYIKMIFFKNYYIG
jgi:hypothetical protein